MTLYLPPFFRSKGLSNPYNFITYLRALFSFVALESLQGKGDFGINISPNSGWSTPRFAQKVPLNSIFGFPRKMSTFNGKRGTLPLVSTCWIHSCHCPCLKTCSLWWITRSSFKVTFLWFFWGHLCIFGFHSRYIHVLHHSSLVLIYYSWDIVAYLWKSNLELE